MDPSINSTTSFLPFHPFFFLACAKVGSTQVGRGLKAACPRQNFRYDENPAYRIQPTGIWCKS